MPLPTSFLKEKWASSDVAAIQARLDMLSIRCWKERDAYSFYRACWISNRIRLFLLKPHTLLAVFLNQSIWKWSLFLWWSSDCLSYHDVCISGIFFCQFPSWIIEPASFWSKLITHLIFFKRTVLYWVGLAKIKAYIPSYEIESIKYARAFKLVKYTREGNYRF